MKGLHPSLLLEADASDPAATSRAVEVFADLANSALNEDLIGTLSKLKPQTASLSTRTSR